ncbi:MAG: VWA domain-containing protein [Tannerellaceae bacterium]|jgi:Ca-activated chloride channel family protein|nr:VWA domain-containing protein [Tannerellaceae bacterium]
MFRFAHPEYLYLYIALPAIVAFYLYARFRQRRDISGFGNPALVGDLMPDNSPKRQTLKFLLLLTAVATVVTMAAGPQFGAKLEVVKRQGIEVMVCLDVSNSMLAEDIAPNRLEKSKQMLSRLADGLADDKFGLIVFAGDAFTQLPITSDRVSAKMFIPSITPSMVSTQGTAVGAAINLAARSFTPNETTDKAIILITDGENHEDDATGAARAAAEKGIRIHIVGVGNPQGAPIPQSHGNSFMKDKAGNVVVTQMNEQMCREIAVAGRGVYVRTDNTGAALRALQQELDKMHKTEMESKTYSEYDEQFPFFAWCSFVLLIIEFLCVSRKSRLFRRIKLFRFGFHEALLVAFLLPAVTVAQKAERQHIREGNKLFGKEKYTEAEIAYRKALGENNYSVEGAYNLANALYKQGKYPEAAEQYRIAIGQTADPNTKDPEIRRRLAETHHNLGNAFMQTKDYLQSVLAYRKALRYNPADDETRYNLALAQHFLQAQQQNQGQDQNQDQQQQDQQEQQQQSQNQQQQEQQQAQEQQSQESNEQMSRENAQQILDAFLQDEKDTQEKVQQLKQQTHSTRRPEKQW